MGLVLCLSFPVSPHPSRGYFRLLHHHQGPRQIPPRAHLPAPKLGLAAFHRLKHIHDVQAPAHPHSNSHDVLTHPKRTTSHGHTGR